MEGIGEEKLYFPLSFEVGKTPESPFRAVSQPVFVTDCSKSLFILFSCPTRTEFEVKVFITFSIGLLAARRLSFRMVRPFCMNLVNYLGNGFMITVTNIETLSDH